MSLISSEFYQTWVVYICHPNLQFFFIFVFIGFPLESRVLKCPTQGWVVHMLKPQEISNTGRWKTDLLATDPRSHCTFKASWLAEISKWDPGRMLREMFNVTFSIHFPYISRACQAKSRVTFWKVIKLKGKLSLLMIEHLDVCDGWYPNNANLPHLTIFNS
jgi:hypothetical protein